MKQMLSGIISNFVGILAVFVGAMFVTETVGLPIWQSVIVVCLPILTARCSNA